MLLFTYEAYGQIFHVQGNISTNLTSVRYAFITFIDETNTSNRYLTITDTAGNYQLSIITDVKNKKPIIPQSIEIGQNYPNPFNPTTTIKYELPRESKVQLIIYNVLGEKVAELVNAFQRVGSYKVEWNAGNFASGVYIYRIKAGDFISSKKLILLK